MLLASTARAAGALGRRERPHTIALTLALTLALALALALALTP